MAKVTLKNIDKIYPNGFQAVYDANIEIQDKEFMVFVGPSGCAKSTTLRMIAGLEEISGGELYIGDTLVNDVAPKDRDIAMVFQNYALYPHMNVYDNMAFGLKLRKFDSEEIDRRVKEAAKVLGIESLLDRKPKELSGGQRQRVAMGRAIVREPKVFLMDEPLSNLDAKLRVQMRAELSKLHERLQTTTIYVTHDQVEAMTLADRIVVMKDGVIQQIDDPITLYNQPNNMFVAGFIGSPAMNFLDAKIEAKGDELVLTGKGFELTIPDNMSQAMKELQTYVGKEVVFGIRPEDIMDPAITEANENVDTVEATVEVIEPMGSETHLHLSIGDRTIVAIVDPQSEAKVGDVIKIGFDLQKMHIFDAETEEAII
ncbi:glycerol-3-phosphate ABC transporter ATP-binding protein [Orenia metallireducens]|jgi:multiple sugar transport system ATP-binding protein|uniref:Glycerol-3-phosphate ABC transporter ATP-binding protein n=1 Tax=Orenia metallireducens TaxID=1413210 RepID=A0A1C0A6H9_9FIRM|nr:sn-glycerol-3-phosphate ABC transporter ATP-binding protein UgpC [Orenia metallireducens]OCL25737.1 glycerol-3-phosphate ABC transporter ATP-binding protein [Orenia metallireducens]